MKVGYLRPTGTFGWYVAMHYGSEVGGICLPYTSHAAVINAVVKGEVQRGIVARENSIGGSVVDTIDPLIADSVGITMKLVGGKVVYSRGKAMVSGEYSLPISQCLYYPEHPEHSVFEIKRVYSHPQGLAQCAGFIARYCGGAELVPTDCTVAGVEKLAQDRNAVAIAPPWAMDLYSGVVLTKEHIEDHEGNVTRFLAIEEKDCLPTGQDKTSLYFQVSGDEDPGSLYWALGFFARARISMSLIESRPTKTQLGRYGFFVDVYGHREDPILKDVLDLLVLSKAITTLRVLGSYSRYVERA